MHLLIDAWESFNSFIYSGGDILVVIFFIGAWMWSLMLERWWYFRFTHPKVAQEELASFRARADRSSWNADKVREMLGSRVRQGLTRGIPMIKTLVALAPLLGLLGTVTGMTEVFQIMAIAGSGNPRAMASGVSRSTIPTMAGMVTALSGMYFVARLQRSAKRASAKFDDELKTACSEG